MKHPQSLADGRYLLVEPLGEGGMATVYRAYDQRLQVWRAIKVLNPEFSSKPRLKARFETEAQTMALLEHTHIVRVYDVGRDGEFAYIVMELVEGGSLVDWLEDNGPMPSRMAVQVTMQVCDGIAAAHRKGVIHRDIKPHNVLVTTDGICRVTDFGIARVGDTKDGMTKTGAVMGTWGYMAPEQRSDAKSVDERADIYATAASLYSLLTNSMPMDLFAADRDASMMEGIPDMLVPVLIKATEYHRDDRYPTIGALKAALAELETQLEPLPDETPPLARDPREPPPIPDPEDYPSLRSARTDPTFMAGVEGDNGAQASPTLMPSAGVAAEAHPTILPQGAQSNTLAPADSTLGEGTTGPGTGTPAAPVRTASGVPAPVREEAPPRRSRAWIGWLTIGIIALVGLGLGLAALGVVAISAIAIDDAEDPPEVAQTEPVDDPEQPEVAVVPTDSAEPDPDPSGEDEPTQGQPEPVQPKPVRTDPVPVKPDPRPVTRPQGTDTQPAGEQPGEAEPDEGTAEPQCFTSVQAPPKLNMLKGSAVFVAELCQEDDTDVVLWYRPVEGTWSSRKMPLAMGAHRTSIELDDRFSRGLEYYVMVGEAAHGAQASPHFVPGPRTD